MNCQGARDLFPALLDRRTSGTAHPEVRVHLAGCPDCQREFAALSQTVAALDAMSPAPTARLRQDFYAMLEEEKNSAASARLAAQEDQRRRRTVLRRWLAFPVAACVLLFAGFQLGARYGAPVPPPAGPDEHTRRELAALRSQVGKMTQLVGYSLLQQQQGPVSDRLRDVLAAARSAEPSPKILDDLISALAFDPSANVRLRALEALYDHADNDVVRAGVRAALPRERNPLVQLEIIDFVATAHDRDAASVLEQMSQNQTIDQSVRTAAERALAQL